jgi:carbohydrate kinase (thermoresistant glucokinase family)
VELWALIVILMGVVGAGKTTVGSLLGRSLGWRFADADDFHPRQNIEKIRQGTPLSDSDRAPWLRDLNQAILRWDLENQNVVLACSALKRKYRDELGRGARVQFVHLRGDYQLIYQRLRARHGHFASEAILKSQFADLEESDDVVTVPIDKTPQEIVDDIVRKLRASTPAYLPAPE